MPMTHWRAQRSLPGRLMKRHVSRTIAAKNIRSGQTYLTTTTRPTTARARTSATNPPAKAANAMVELTPSSWLTPGPGQEGTVGHSIGRQAGARGHGVGRWAGGLQATGSHSTGLQGTALHGAGSQATGEQGTETGPPLPPLLLPLLLPPQLLPLLLPPLFPLPLLPPSEDTLLSTKVELPPTERDPPSSGPGEAVVGVEPLLSPP